MRARLKRTLAIAALVFSSACLDLGGSCLSAPGGLCTPGGDGCPGDYYCSVAGICTRACEAVADCTIRCEDGCPTSNGFGEQWTCVEEVCTCEGECREVVCAEGQCQAACFLDGTCGQLADPYSGRP